MSTKQEAELQNAIRVCACAHVIPYMVPGANCRWFAPCGEKIAHWTRVWCTPTRETSHLAQTQPADVGAQLGHAFHHLRTQLPAPTLRHTLQPKKRRRRRLFTGGTSWMRLRCTCTDRECGYGALEGKCVDDSNRMAQLLERRSRNQGTQVQTQMWAVIPQPTMHLRPCHMES